VGKWGGGKGSGGEIDEIWMDMGVEVRKVGWVCGKKDGYVNTKDGVID
jgi:hypothetical protein